MYTEKGQDLYQYTQGALILIKIPVRSKLNEQLLDRKNDNNNLYLLSKVGRSDWNAHCLLSSDCVNVLSLFFHFYFPTYFSTSTMQTWGTPRFVKPVQSV